MAVNSPQKRSPPKLRLVSSQEALAEDERRPPAPPEGDADLLQALRRGDAAAAAAFHDRVRPEVDRTLFRLLGRRDTDHEDMAQLAMIELIYTIDRYRGECSLDSWASTLTAHVAYKHLRRRQTERRLFGRGGAPEDLQIASPQRLGRDTIARSAITRVSDHLNGLDANRAWTFVLHDVLGYDLREIAVITGVSVAAAQTRLVRGRRELHQRIEADPELANVLEEMEVGR
jgi:RNA polymerase sigma-70 factor (ECF subfamily)